MAERQPYSRIYWSVLDDPKFDTIRGDTRSFGAWSLMLLLADMAYPAPAFVPPPVSARSLALLCDAGLVHALPGGLYRLNGLEAERTRRADSATRPPTKRGPTGTQPGTKRDPVGELDETRRGLDETSRDETDAPEPDAAVSLNVRTGVFPSQKLIGWLNDLANAHGERRLAELIDQTPTESRNVSEYLRAIQDTLRAQDHLAGKAEAADEKRRLEEKRRPPVLRRVEEDITDEEAERIAAEYLAANQPEGMPA